MMSEPILRLENICKSFFGVQVLYDISLELYEGEVLGLVGENGAGKSTMMNVVGGVLPGDSGTMYVNGKEYKPSSPRMATEAGIGFIHQELSLFTNLSVAENIFIDDYPKKFAGFIDKKETCSRTKGFLERYHVDVKNPNTVVGSLSMGTRQMIEILKALVKEAKILIFDEPTTSLSGREKETLFETIRELKKSGYSIVYISHILEDVLLLSDRISVLRDGHVIRTDRTANWTKEEMIRQMVGRDMKQVYPEVQKTIGSETVLETKGLCCAGFVKDVSLQLKKGEILGMFGLMGAGRSEVARAVFGVDPIESGEVIIKGTPFTRITPELCIRNKMAFVTENRREEGLLMPKTVCENAALVLERDLVGRLGIIDVAREEQMTEKAISEMGVKSADPRTQAVNSLSGGNQQKVVVGKWVVTEPEILIVDEPTRGIDVGAKYEIYKLLKGLAARGAAILFISSEMEELMGMCDSIIAMKDGVISGRVDRSEFSQENIGTLAL
ncbi:sugar ABC transporter ATP-binding protein [Clostridium sp. AN503]|uniref:sugar ABC transporter ATP-binding protein n=1 Tax=Clostridium sp. AN503 TaxID=3160598 RepID=UPI00345751E8